MESDGSGPVDISSSDKADYDYGPCWWVLCDNGVAGWCWEAELLAFSKPV